MDCFVAEPVIEPATSGRTRWLLAMTTWALLDLLVRIDAPQPVLFDKPVIAFADQPAPQAAAAFDRSEHPRLQLGGHRRLRVRLGVQLCQVGLGFELHDSGAL